MSSIYHILHKIPTLDIKKLDQEYSELAKQLIQSGKIRIDADDKRNFVILSDPILIKSLNFSYQELYEEQHIATTKEKIATVYQVPTSSKKVEETLKQLKYKINLLLPVSQEQMSNLVCLLIQAAHPIVIRWLIFDKVEIFISYANEIGDVMDIITWKIAGTNSGMQSTDGADTSVFISCGGDPLAVMRNIDPNFFTQNENDGWRSIARLQIIAGQELGHFADLVRDDNGKQIDRHSANFSCTYPKSHVQAGRLKDIENCNIIEKYLENCKLARMIKYEEQLINYEAQKLNKFMLVIHKIIYRIIRYIFVIEADNRGLKFVKLFSQDKYIGKILYAMLKDMQFNLAPIADVYKSDDKNRENAIACAEALARVPQQVMKWGQYTTKIFMNNLYQIYYGEVIPSLIQKYEVVTGKKYKRNHTMPQESLYKKLRLLFAKEVKIKPIRDI